MIEGSLGIAFALITIFISRRNQWEQWSYTLCLPFLPLIYMFFGLFADEQGVILQELLYGIPFFIAGILLITYGFTYSGYLLALLWIGHGFYDMFHHLLFSNSGVPSWYPVLCAGVDIVLGAYIFYRSATLQGGNIRHFSTTPH